MEPSTYWLIAGGVMVALEAFTIPGIGFFFGGLAAVIVGGLIMSGVLGSDQVIWQIGIWFAFTSIMAVGLWKPLQKLRVSKNADSSFNNIVGTHAKVIEAPLKTGFPGKVSWSGTNMNARLEAGSTSEVPVGAVVLITRVDGNTVTVKVV